MALLKFDSSIVSMHGSVGGDTYRKDNSGQHVYSRPRYKNFNPTTLQQASLAWYGNEKRELKHHPNEPEPYEDPTEQTTAIVFSIDVIWAHMTRSWNPPQLTQIVFAGPSYQLWVNYAHNIYKSAYREAGITEEMIAQYGYKQYHIQRLSKMLDEATAVEKASIHVRAWLKATIEIRWMPIVEILGALYSTAFFYMTQAFLDGKDVHLEGYKGECLIYQPRSPGFYWSMGAPYIRWAKLVARRTKQMYDFVACDSTGILSYTFENDPMGSKYSWNILNINELYQTWLPGWIYHNLYTWEDIYVHHRGAAYEIGANLFRMKCPTSQQKYWDVPVGWQTSEANPCRFPLTFEERFH
jgi:hypothetical protein